MANVNNNFVPGGLLGMGHQQQARQALPLTGGLEPQPHPFGLNLPRQPQPYGMHGPNSRFNQAPLPQGPAPNLNTASYQGHNYQPNPHGFGTIAGTNGPGSGTMAPYLGYNIPWLEKTIAQGQQMAAGGQATGLGKPSTIAMYQAMLDRLQPGGASYNDPRRVGSQAEQMQAGMQQYDGRTAGIVGGNIEQMQQQGIPQEAIQRLAAAFGTRVGSTGRR